MQADNVAHAPEFLSGDDGETVFIRSDLAMSAPEARNYAFTQGSNVSGWAVDVVEMLPVPDHFTEIEYEWAAVRDGTPDGVRYWRFQC